MKHSNQKPHPSYFFIKRAFDIAAALLGLIIGLIPMAVIALCIRLDSPGPVLFSQTRTGQGGRPFKIYKFRSMLVTAPPDTKASLLADAERYITRTGRILRKTSLDELPQLWNILRGDMSFVGYRPVCATETQLNERRQELGVFAGKPGLTGLAQIRGRDDLGFEEKSLLDAEYTRRRSLALDAYCLIKTIPVVLSHKGVR